MASELNSPQEYTVISCDNHMPIRVDKPHYKLEINLPLRWIYWVNIFNHHSHTFTVFCDMEKRCPSMEYTMWDTQTASKTTGAISVPMQNLCLYKSLLQIIETTGRTCASGATHIFQVQIFLLPSH